MKRIIYFFVLVVCLNTNAQTNPKLANPVQVKPLSADLLKQLSLEMKSSEAKLKAVADSVEKLIRKLQTIEDSLRDADMSEMDKFDLQRKMQDVSQAISTLSAIIKEMDDNQKKILNNLRSQMRKTPNMLASCRGFA